MSWEVPTLAEEAHRLQIPGAPKAETCCGPAVLALPTTLRKGDLLVQIMVRIPSSLSKRQEELLKEFAALEEEKPVQKIKKAIKKADKSSAYKFTKNSVFLSIFCFGLILLQERFYPVLALCPSGLILVCSSFASVPSLAALAGNGRGILDLFCVPCHSRLEKQPLARGWVKSLAFNRCCR